MLPIFVCAITLVRAKQLQMQVSFVWGIALISEIEARHDQGHPGIIYELQTKEIAGIAFPSMS